MDELNRLDITEVRIKELINVSEETSQNKTHSQMARKYIYL